MGRIFREAFQGTALRVSLVIWSFGYVLVALSAMLQGNAGFVSMLAANVPLGLLGVTLSTLLGYLFERLHDRPGFLRWAIAGTAALAAGVVQTSADVLFLRLLALTILPDWSWALSFDTRRITILFIIYDWSILMTLGLVWAARAGDLARMNEARAAAFEAAATRAEIAALRLQLNPHFLFNTLNGIASLVVRGRQAQAEEMIGRLADFLRSSLASNPTDLIPLEQELATVRAYLNIEATRFEDRLSIAYDVDPSLMGLPVPNFVLQPLVENAIKHGAAGTRGKVLLTIAAQVRDGVAILRVRNQGDRPVPPAPGGNTGLGLANTRHRLERHYGDRAALDARPEGQGFLVEIRLPCDALAIGAAA